MANNLNKTTNKDQKAKVAILVVTIILTLLFAILAMLPIYDENNNETRTVSGALSIGSKNIYISGTSYVYYSFTPTTSGSYTFTSSSSSTSIDPRATLYNSNWTSLREDDDSAGRYHFKITYNLVSGNTYYLGIRLYNDNPSGSITVTVAHS